MCQAGVIAIKQKSGRGSVDLRAVIDPEGFANARRRLMFVLGVYQHLVQLGCGNLSQAFLLDLIDNWQDLVNALPGLG